MQRLVTPRAELPIREYCDRLWPAPTQRKVPAGVRQCRCLGPRSHSHFRHPPFRDQQFGQILNDLRKLECKSIVTWPDKSLKMAPGEPEERSPGLKLLP